MKIAVLGLILSMASAVPVLAADDTLQSEKSSAVMLQTAFLSVGTKSLSQPSVTKVQYSHWHFVGCANSHQHCHHLAEHAGYHHATVKHDHHRCHHAPGLACYARN